MAASFRRTRGRGGNDWAGGLAARLRDTLAQAGAVKDVLARGAQEGRARLQSARATRQRDTVLAELGAAIVELIERGEIDPAELPEVQPLLARLAELDAAGDRGGAAEDEVPAWGARERFDHRPPPSADDGDDGTVSSGASLRARFERPGPDDEDLSEYMHPDDVPAKRR